MGTACQPQHTHSVYWLFSMAKEFRESRERACKNTLCMKSSSRNTEVVLSPKLLMTSTVTSDRAALKPLRGEKMLTGTEEN